MPSHGATPTSTADQQQWLRIRRYLQDHRHELSGTAAALYPDVPTVAGTSLLTAPAWIPDTPIPLHTVDLTWTSRRSPGAVNGTEPVTEQLRPLRADGTRHPSYSAAVAELAAPGVFENRPTYRLHAADLAGHGGGGPVLGFRPGTYFDGVDVGDAGAHELAARRLDLIPDTPLRAAVGDPRDLGRRPANMAISTLTLRLDRATGQAGFPLHRRDPAKVGHAGGLYMVMPVGIFQAAHDAPAHQANDFSLWRCMLREYAEELLGRTEEYGSEPIDYGSWPFAAAMTRARDTGSLHAHVLGLGVDPLTFATDLLTVVTIDSELYDHLFGGLVRTNGEGRLAELDETGSAGGRFPFTAEAITRLTTDQPIQAAGAALIRLAWRHREALTAIG